jgi:hypothetical protein
VCARMKKIYGVRRKKTVEKKRGGDHWEDK